MSQYESDPNFSSSGHVYKNHGDYETSADAFEPSLEE